ncbi:hypothetical protein [Mycoplasma sp. 4423]
MTNFVTNKITILSRLESAKNTNILFKEGAKIFLKKSKTHQKIGIGILTSLIFAILILEISLQIAIKYNIFEMKDSEIINLNYIRMIDIIYVIYFIVTFKFLKLYTKALRKSKVIIENLIEKFEFHQDEYFLNGITETNYFKNKPIYHIDYESEKKVLLNYEYLIGYSSKKQEIIAMNYFFAWGYHFKEVHNGNLIYIDLYKQFLYLKNEWINKKGLYIK